MNEVYAEFFAEPYPARLRLQRLRCSASSAFSGWFYLSIYAFNTAIENDEIYSVLLVASFLSL